MVGESWWLQTYKGTLDHMAKSVSMTHKMICIVSSCLKGLEYVTSIPKNDLERDLSGHLVESEAVFLICAMAKTCRGGC